MQPNSPIIEATEQNIQQILEQSQQIPVIVDFWAEWCGPCKMISPMVDAVASEVEGTAKVGKCNLDDGQALAAKYGIRSIPTMIIFVDSIEKSRRSGAMDSTTIINWVRSQLT